MKEVKLLSAFGIAFFVGYLVQYNPWRTITLNQDHVHIEKTVAVDDIIPGADFEKAANIAVPSVVHIRTIIKRADKNWEPDLPFDDDFFKKFFGGIPFRQPNQRASASGVILNNQGYIVTNAHVVVDAAEILVTLNDRKNFKATLLGIDENTDLAVIKIDGKNFPTISIGNSDSLHLGQWVLAVGYPLNLDVTVTHGIISAKSRYIGISQTNASPSPVDAFIQTDAAVNPGSSGGALVNIKGELVGISSAIISPTGAYAGYAYAITSNLMLKVVVDIIKFGSVQRGYLGINMAPPDLDSLRKKELGINDDIAAVWVLEVDPSGAAAEAGIQKGDALTKINGIPVSTISEASELMARQNPGDTITLTYLRGKTEKTAHAVLKNKVGVFPGQKAKE